ncbi:MAG: DUF1800 family protein [Phycisphaerae bacterium]
MRLKTLHRIHRSHSFVPTLGMAIAMAICMAGCPAPDQVGQNPPSGQNPVTGADVPNSNSSSSNSNGSATDDPDTVVSEDTVVDPDTGVVTTTTTTNSNPDNKPPVGRMSLSPSGNVGPGVEVRLDGSQSSDPDGDALAFTWSQLQGANVVFSSNNANIVTITTPFVVEDAVIVLQLSVDDGNGGVAKIQQSINVKVADQFAGNAQSLLPYRETLTSDEAYHLLRRTEFGAAPARVSAVIRDGMADTVEQMIRGETVPTSVISLAETYGNNVDRRWMVYLLESPNPFHEKMAMFWHDRFATSARVLNGQDRPNAIGHIDMLRRNCLGNYRDFLEDLTIDPVMLVWLDGANSPKDAPNENYAREFWELFTLGRDVLYSETDIREAARAFTGITLLRVNGQPGRPIFDIVNHDATMKHVFPGRAAQENHDYASIIDLTLEQPEAARFVARNLFEYFVHDHPSDTVINELAAEFVDADFEIGVIVEKILKSQAMFSPEARFTRIASPVEHIVGVARTLDTHLHSEDAQGYLLTNLMTDLSLGGQELMNPPGVQGWDEGAAWLEDQWVIGRIRAFARLIRMDHGPDRVSGQPYHILPPQSEWGEREVRDRLVDAVANVFHLNLSEAEHDIYVEVLDQNGYLAFHLAGEYDQDRYLLEMIRLMMMDERVIGY